MIAFKCKMCGGQTTLDSKNGIAICDYCGTKQALPLFSDDSERLLYESGNNYLSHNEYDKAENVFNQLLTIKPNAAELYWDLVLCKYGVTYVKDPKTDKYIPTCNRTHYSSIFNDENYIKAIEYANEEQKALFEEDAKYIDDVQKSIVAIAKNEKPFDIFICYKETDTNGNRTKDSVEAQKLYEKLTEAGYKVFFSRITLEDKIGTEYEPYIYAALASSKVMITIGSSKENFEATWVKNEWSRFLSLQQRDSNKTIIPLYFDMEKDELPDEFVVIPSFDINENGFEFELIRGIKKQIPLPIIILQKRKARKKALIVTLLSFLSVVAICGVFFVPSIIKNNINRNKYDKAMQLYYEGKYAESSWAFSDISDYKDASKQQKKSETAWRKSLSTVYYNGYYITDSGTVNTINGKLGNAHTKIDVAKNGKVSSIVHNNIYGGYDTYLTVIHENGYCTNPELDNILSKKAEWKNVIKVSESLQYGGVVGLKSDGTMAIISSEYISQSSSQLEELSTWSNIVDFKHNFIGSSGGMCGIMVGLKSDGTLCAIHLTNQHHKQNKCDLLDMNKIKKNLEEFKNIKSFAIGVYQHEKKLVSLVALTKDNKLLVYSDGEVTETDGKDICEIISNDIVLMSNGDLVELNSERILARDIIYAGACDAINYGECYAITRNGTIIELVKDYGSGQISAEQTGNKTTVCEEWISRLD